jgi:5-methylcytosine-specific restriction enzyme A
VAWSKESRQSRGYDAEWDRIRLVILKRDNYLCHCPDCKGGEKRTKLATEVDHIITKAECKRRGWTRAQTDHPSNLRAVNKDCHKRLTQEQQGYQPKHQVGADGWPSDPSHHWNRPPA